VHYSSLFQYFFPIYYGPYSNEDFWFLMYISNLFIQEVICDLDYIVLPIPPVELKKLPLFSIIELLNSPYKIPQLKGVVFNCTFTYQ